MLQRLKELLIGSPDDEGASPRSHSTGYPPEVAVAALLLEVASADDHLHVLEQATLANGLRQQFGLDADGVEAVIARAEAARRDSISLHEFTSVILREYSEPRRLAIVEVLWRVILADGELTTDETVLARRLGHLLELRPEDVSVAIRNARAR